MHEGCIEQISRLFREKVFAGEVIPVDHFNRIRLDDLEMNPDIQNKIMDLWPKINSENLRVLTNFDEYQKEFLKLFGFGHEKIDYSKEVNLQNPF